MKNVFISIPMNGRPEEEVLTEIQEITDYIHHTFGEEDIYITHSLWTPKPAIMYPNPRIYYLGKAIVKMGICDTVVFAKGWREARGCRIEEQVAIEYGLDRLYVDDNGPVLCIHGIA